VAVSRGSLPIVIGGTLLFGALLFLLGLLVGVNLSASVPPPARAVASPPVPSPAPVQTQTAPDAPPPPAKSGDAIPEAAPAIQPVKVKGFGYGAPPSSQPASVLRGRLLQQAGSDADPAAAQPATSTTPAASPAKEPPAEPLVFSVAVGRFLLESNAVRRLAELRAKGFQPVVVIADPPDPAGWLTITLGPRGDALQAGRLAEDASAQGFETALVSWLAP